MDIRISAGNHRLCNTDLHLNQHDYIHTLILTNFDMDDHTHQQHNFTHPIHSQLLYFSNSLSTKSLQLKAHSILLTLRLNFTLRWISIFFPWLALAISFLFLTPGNFLTQFKLFLGGSCRLISKFLIDFDLETWDLNCSEVIKKIFSKITVKIGFKIFAL